jgi:hypothetical protein
LGPGKQRERKTLQKVQVIITLVLCHVQNHFPFWGEDNTEAALKVFTQGLIFTSFQEKQSLVNEAFHVVSSSSILDQDTGVF